MSRFTTILFDLDGTLIDTIADLADATEAALRYSGRGRADGQPVYSFDEYHQFVGNGCLKLVERAMGEATPEEIACAYKRFMEIYDQNYCVKTAPYDGIYALLDELVKRGYKLGIVTNKPEIQARKLAELLFSKYPFGCVYGGAVEGRPHKPDPQVVQLALNDLQATAEETLFVGDSNVDILTGHNAGMVAAGAVWGFRGEAELREAGADILIKQPLDLLQYL
ncbi:MAG: HAD-IA family hydrolase [Clostridia bacterium]|nr:HAD-IA family hydrolase [Clostridia bacterium]